MLCMYVCTYIVHMQFYPLQKNIQTYIHMDMKNHLQTDIKEIIQYNMCVAVLEDLPE